MIMKNSFIAALTLFLLAGFAIQACDRPAQETDRDTPIETERGDVERGIEVDRDDRETDARTENFRTDAEMQIADNNRIIEEHRHRLQTEEVDNREEYEERLEEYEQRNLDMERRLHEYEATGDDDWEEFQNEFNKSMEDLRNSLRDFFNNNNNR
jgi:TolA-binding protein